LTGNQNLIVLTTNVGNRFDSEQNKYKLFLYIDCITIFYRHFHIINTRYDIEQSKMLRS
jgi:hypothetical protein